MLDFILAEPNRVFAFATGAVLVIATLEVILAMGGLGMMGALDNLVPDDFDIDVGDVDAGIDLDADADLDVDVDAGGGANFLHMLLGFFGVGRVPLLVVIVSFLGSFGMAGYLVQWLMHGVTGLYLPGLIAMVPAFIGGSFATRHLALAVGRLVPDVETEAVDSGSFVGRTAVITLGEARAGHPAQGKLRDHNGQTHYLMVEPDEEDKTYRQGDEVLLVSKEGSVFKAIDVPSDALSRD